MLTTHFNGKFTAQRTTGVQRYAHQLVMALDQHLAMQTKVEAPPCLLLCPPGAVVPALTSIAVRHVGQAGLPLHVWEQSVLPWAARAGRLVNLAGSAPRVAARQWCTFHDAAVFDHPHVHKPAFAAWYRNHFRWLARHSQRLLTVSSHSRARLATHLGVAPDAIAIVPNGSDHLLALHAEKSILAELGLEPGRFILAVGSDNPIKNLQGLELAWTGLARESTLRLVIVGGRNAAVFAANTGLGPKPGVVRAGVVTDAALKALYGQALGLAFPSLDEGFGLPPLEAMSLACPVAAARAGAIPEVCGNAVLYFDPTSIPAITAALQQLVANPELRQRLSAAGLQRAAAWTWARSAQTLSSLLWPGAEVRA